MRSRSLAILVGLGLSVVVGCGGSGGDGTESGSGAQTAANPTPIPAKASGTAAPAGTTPTIIVGPAAPSPDRDSVSCTVDGVTLNAEFTKVASPCTAASAAGCSTAEMTVHGVPGTSLGIIRPEENGSVVYEKTAIGPSDAMRYLIMISNGFGQWGVIDIVSSGDEDSGSITYKFVQDDGTDSVPVTKTFSGGKVSCKITPAST